MNDAENAVQTALVIGLFKAIRPIELPVFLYEQEEDLMTSVNTKLIQFTIDGFFHLFFTPVQIEHDGKKYRKVETDKFQLTRKFTGDFMTALSVKEGKTKSLLLVYEPHIEKMMAENALQQLKQEYFFSKEQIALLESITVDTGINQIGTPSEVFLKWSEEKEAAEAKLCAGNLSWNFYLRYREDVEKAQSWETSWEDGKLIEMQYSAK